MSDSDDDVGPSIPVGFVPPADDDDSQSIGQKRGANGGSAQPVKKRKPKGATLARPLVFVTAQRSL
jgi:hypothetical protein